MTNIEIIKGVKDIIEKSLEYAEVSISPNNFILFLLHFTKIMLFCHFIS